MHVNRTVVPSRFVWRWEIDPSGGVHVCSIPTGMFYVKYRYVGAHAYAVDTRGYAGCFDIVLHDSTLQSLQKISVLTWEMSDWFSICF